MFVRSFVVNADELGGVATVLIPSVMEKKTKEEVVHNLMVSVCFFPAYFGIASEKTHTHTQIEHLENRRRRERRKKK